MGEAHSHGSIVENRKPFTVCNADVTVIKFHEKIHQVHVFTPTRVKNKIIHTQSETNIIFGRLYCHISETSSKAS